jgi:2-amino-4-hydroxy-6-hydroxymethyldihydropteridine diphosphokinase
MDETSLITVYVALGSNLGDREGHLVQACEDIASLSGASQVVCSSVYETDPMGPQNQPDYLNAVCRFHYSHSPLHLLDALQAIEHQHGRVQSTERWTARPLDLDIVLFGCERIDEPRLRVPHVGVAERSFVLWPLLELAPEIHIPGLGLAKDLARHCQQFGIKAYERSAK